MHRIVFWENLYKFTAEITESTKNLGPHISSLSTQLSRYHNMFARHIRQTSLPLYSPFPCPHMCTTFPVHTALLHFPRDLLLSLCAALGVRSSWSVLDSRRRLRSSLSASSQHIFEICFVACLCSFCVSRRLSPLLLWLHCFGRVCFVLFLQVQQQTSSR